MCGTKNETGTVPRSILRKESTSVSFISGVSKWGRISMSKWGRISMTHFCAQK